MPSGRPPNVLVIMSDQHRADVLGCAGHPVASTPNIDRLAAEGVRFSAVTCQGPLCMPARASFLTERYVRDHGVYTNWASVAPGTPTYLHALRAAGYHTVAIGKQHLTGETVAARHQDDLAHHLHERGFAEVHETGDKFAGRELPNRYIDMLDRRGLLDVYLEHLAARSYHGESGRGDSPTKQVPMWDSTPLPISLDAYVDVWHGEYARSWVESYESEAPFFCFVGFPGPHDPWDAPAEARRRYDKRRMPLPHSTRRPQTDGAGTYGRLLDAFLTLSDTETMTDDAIREMRRAYAADVSVIDDAIGRIVDSLEARGLLDSTWIFYTSDHGEMGGDHGLMSKCVFYEQTLRVPLVVRPPQCAPAFSGRVVDDLVEHIDVPATIRAVAGAPAVPGGEGRSLLHHLDDAAAGSEGTASDPRSVSVSENWGFAAFTTLTHRLVVDEDSCEPNALFDLVADPAEDENIVARPEAQPILDELMETVVRPFLRVDPRRPHKSPFTGNQGS